MTVEKWEKSLPEGRYLMPFEIAAQFGVDIKRTIADYQISAMQKTWFDFCKKQDLPQDEWIGDHAIASAWTKYANKYHRDPLPQVAAKSWEND